MAETPAPAAELKRELGLRDLTLFAVACIVGTRWIPAAAHFGPGAVTLWLLAAVLFMAPLAYAVGALAAKYPGVGGFYLWTRNDFGPWPAFLCFWCYWVGIAVWFPSAALFYMSAGIEGLGRRWAHLALERGALVGIALAAVWIALGTNLVGMRIGKWTENLGASATWVLGALLVAAAALAAARRGSATVIDIRPAWNFDAVNSWATFAYAMSGIEVVSLMGAEIHSPARNLPRAGWLASGFAFAFYAAATVAMLVLVPGGQISEMSGYTQAGAAAGVLLGRWFAPLIAVLVMASAVGQFGGLGTAVSRLPFAVGGDRLLPAAFARVHPKWGTPHVAILVLGAVASLLMVAMQAGDTLAAAYRALVSLMVITGFLPYLYLFACAWKAGGRVSAVLGCGMTLLAIACSLAPTAEVGHVWLFETKLAAGTLAVAASGWLLYRRAQRES